MKRNDVLKRLMDESERQIVSWRRSRGLRDGQGPVTALFRTVAPRTVSQEYEHCMAYLRFLRDWRDLKRETELMLEDSRFFMLMAPEWHSDMLYDADVEGFDYVLRVKGLVRQTTDVASQMKLQLEGINFVDEMRNHSERFDMIDRTIQQAKLEQEAQRMLLTIDAEQSLLAMDMT